MIGRAESFRLEWPSIEADPDTCHETSLPSFAGALTLLIVVISGSSVPAQDTAEGRAQVLALGDLTAAPAVHPADGFAAEGGLRPLFFEGLPYRGKPTRVFAWYGAPGGGEGAGKRPAMVLVHGGGGTAFKEWVKRWNEHGFAAISIAVEGQTDEPCPQADGRTWKRHAWAGPAATGSTPIALCPGRPVDVSRGRRRRAGALAPAVVSGSRRSGRSA